MKFFSKFIHQIQPTKQPFTNIEGYEDLKEIVKRALDSEDNYALLFIGPPASSKTEFLKAIQVLRPDALLFDASNTTNRILDVLEEERPKIICIDEIDKFSKIYQGQILNLLETGRVIVTQQKRRYDFQLKGLKCFATANDLRKITRPLQSRFRKLFLQRYTEEQFLAVAEKVLPKFSPSIARYIGTQIWNNQGDIRDVISVGRLMKRDDGPEQIGMIIQTIMKYSQQEQDEER